MMQRLPGPLGESRECAGEIIACSEAVADEEDVHFARSPTAYASLCARAASDELRASVWSCVESVVSAALREEPDCLSAVSSACLTLAIRSRDRPPVRSSWSTYARASANDG